MSDPITNHTYAFSITVDATADEIDPKVREALQEQGFGILTEIDVQQTLITKTGEDIGPYRILGACNPPLAKQAIAADGDIGALLPCNVVIRASTSGGTDVLFADPEAMLAMSNVPGLKDLACDAKERLRAAAKAIAG